MIYKSQVFQTNPKGDTQNHNYGMGKYVKFQVCHLKLQVWYVQICESKLCFCNRKYATQYHKCVMIKYVNSQV